MTEETLLKQSKLILEKFNWLNNLQHKLCTFPFKKCLNVIYKRKYFK